MLPGRILTTSVEFPPSRFGKNSLVFQAGLLVAVASALPNPTSFRGQVKILVCGEKSPSDHLYGDLALSYTCPLPFLGLFSSFLFLPSTWLQGAPLSHVLEGNGALLTLNLFFMHSRERELQQECCRQDTSRPFLTTFHEFKSSILMDAKATAEKGVREGRRKDIC